LAEKSEPFRKIIVKIFKEEEKSEPFKKMIEEEVEKKIVKRTSKTIFDDEFFIEIQKFLAERQANQKPVDFTALQPNDFMNWIAKKVNDNPKLAPGYVKLINRLFDESAFQLAFNEETQKIIPYRKRKEGGRPGADLNPFGNDMKVLMLFLKEQYPDLMQNYMMDYTFFIDLFKIYTKHLLEKE
jgi:hypothetical protein